MKKKKNLIPREFWNFYFRQKEKMCGSNGEMKVSVRNQFQEEKNASSYMTRRRGGLICKRKKGIITCPTKRSVCKRTSNVGKKNGENW